MQQSLYTTSLISKYIKSLLANTPLPLYSNIENGGYMLKDYVYIHKTKIIKCTQSGIFIYNASTLTNDYEYIKVFGNQFVYDKTSNMYKLVTESVKTSIMTEIPVATYNILQNYTFGNDYSGITTRYISNTSYYDEVTHKFLGHYLRLLKNYYELDLMSLYNCYGGKILNNVSLNTKTPYVTQRTNLNTKLLMVPIKFNTDYSVFFNYKGNILIKGVIYGNNLLKDNNGNIVSNMLSDTTDIIVQSTYNQPFIINISNINKDINGNYYNSQQYEPYLYMAIQVEINNETPLVVMEGDFTSTNVQQVVDANMFNEDDNNILNTLLISKPSIIPSQNKHLEKGDGIKFNTYKPFSDKLISYLIRNTIDCREFIDENITSIQELIGYETKYKGLWSTKLRYELYNKYIDKHKDTTDILGYVDRDIEKSLLQKEI